jgi:D-alanyl-D-alanine carboxypeptidase
LMNKKARALGMRRTQFMNASGLPNRKQKSTARDMAILSKAIQDHFPKYYRYFSTKAFTYKGRTYKTHNRLLKGYRGTDGIKTGYTRASGFNLTTSVRRKNQHLIGVVLGGKTSNSRDTHMKYILDKSFARIVNDPTLLPRMAVVPMPRHKPGVFNPGVRVASNAKPGASNTSRAGLAGLQLSEAQSSGTPLTFTPPQIEQGDRVPGSVQPGWGIQIGAYQASEAARLFLIKAIETEPSLLSRATSAIMPIELGRSTLYRARFGPMSYEQARGACTVLKSRAFSCFEVNERNWPEANNYEENG